MSLLLIDVFLIKKILRIALYRKKRIRKKLFVLLFFSWFWTTTITENRMLQPGNSKILINSTKKLPERDQLKKQQK